MATVRLQVVIWTVLWFIIAVERAGAVTIYEEIAGIEINRIVDAIYLTEGGEKASKPYGILSIPCNGRIECRKICLNTVRNNHRRWIEDGRREPFIDFLAKRYAPIGAGNDPGNLNKSWAGNVRYFLAENGKK